MSNSPAIVPSVETRPAGTLQAVLDGTIKIPESVSRVIDMRSWALALTTREPYSEPDPDYLSRMLMIQTLSATTMDEAMTQAGISKLRESIPNVPGAGTGPIRITGFYVATSDFDEGFPTYLIIDTVSMVHGLEKRYSTGAGQLQAQLMVALCLGMIPLECEITRTERKDKGGFYMFWLQPPNTENPF